MVSDIRTSPLVRPDERDHVDALMFLITEAELADDNDLGGWLALVDQGIEYTVPVQTTRHRQDPATGAVRSFLLNEDRVSVELRVRRYLESDSVWAENPPSRVRRFVSNVRVRRADDGGLHVWSYLMLTRSRSDRDSYDLISAERHDHLVRTGSGDLRLRAREVTIDQSRLGMANLPFPL